MRELTLTQRFALIGLNAQDSLHMSMAKKMTLRAIAAATILEGYMTGSLIIEEEYIVLSRPLLQDKGMPLYQETVIKAILQGQDRKNMLFCTALKKAARIRGTIKKRLEKQVSDSLTGEKLLEEVPNLLGCDMAYITAGVDLREYRSDMEEYTRQCEMIRAEVLEEGELTEDMIALLWLLRESGCMHDIFSDSELPTVSSRIEEACRQQRFAERLFGLQIYKTLESVAKQFVQLKHRAMGTATGTGINFIYPIFDRTQSVFIDTEAWFEKPEQRLADLETRLTSRGHAYTVISGINAPILKIDNICYQAIPEAVICSRVPIQGVRLRKYYV
ncbi:MAG: hypothetical protein RRX92_02645 [Lachnospiraceae bacterium]